MERWMTKYSDRKFRDLRIVGTHHSACYEIDGRDVIKSSFSRVKCFAFCFPGIFASWSRCQSRKIETQLRMGVRYFDIRVAYTNGKIYVAHSCRGPELRIVLNEFLAFYGEPKNFSEISVLRFRPDVGNKKTMDCEEAQKVFRDTFLNHQIRAYIQNVLNPFSKSLQELRKKPIIVVWTHGTTNFIISSSSTHQNNTGFDRNVLGFGYHVPRHFNHWLRTDAIATLRKRMEGTIEKVSKEQKEFPLTVCQNILTPSTKTIVYSILYRVLLCVLLPICVVMYGILWWIHTETVRTQVLPHFTMGIPFLVLILFYSLTRPRWRLLDEKTKLAQLEFIKNFCVNPDANKDFNVITVDGVTTEFCREVIRLNEKDSSSKPAAAVMGTGLVVSSSKHDDSSS